jgi:hypothetical protein
MNGKVLHLPWWTWWCSVFMFQSGVRANGRLLGAADRELGAAGFGCWRRDAADPRVGCDRLRMLELEATHCGSGSSARQASNVGGRGDSLRIHELIQFCGVGEGRSHRLSTRRSLTTGRVAPWAHRAPRNPAGSHSR